MKKSGWDLLGEGHFEEAIHAFSKEISGSESSPDRYNRGLAFLNLKQYPEALEDFKNNDDGRSDADSVFKGVCSWLMGDQKEAVNHWKDGLNRPYTDGTQKGVEPRSFLFYAAVRIPDPTLEKEAKRLLKKAWNPNLRLCWPGPIMGYLLGEIDEEDFLENQTFQNETLEVRRQCKANFWAGVHSLCEEKQEKTMKFLQRSANSSFGILEPEFYLARGEINFLNEQN